MRRLFTLLLFVVASSMASWAWMIPTSVHYETVEYDFTACKYRVLPLDAFSRATGNHLVIETFLDDAFRLNAYSEAFYCAYHAKPNSMVDAEVSGPIMFMQKGGAVGLFVFAAGSSGDCFIRKLTLTMVPIEDTNSRPIVLREGCADIEYKLAQNVPNDGLTYFDVTITPKIPMTSLPISVESFNVSRPTDITGGSKLLAGYVVTRLKLEYYKGLNNEYAVTDFLKQLHDLQEYRETGEIREWMTKQNINKLNDHYISASTADVNEDGVVNGADVVSVYNTILNGREAQMVDGHRFVDLALPSGTLWATCNVGAAVPESYGDYFDFREYRKGFMSGKNIFTNDTHEYNFYPEKIEYDGWGPNWKLPTKPQYQELIDNCTYELTTINGARYVVFTSKNNHQKIVFPCAGGVYENPGYSNLDLSDSGYWTADFVSDIFKGLALSFGGGETLTPTIDEVYAYIGYPVRLVHKAQ